MTQRSSAEQEQIALLDAIRRVASGERDAFEELYRRTSAKLFGVCLRILPRTDAEEALQETYLALWRSAGSFDPSRGSPMAWMVTAARNRAIDRLRAGRTHPAAPVELAERMADPQPGAPERIEFSQEEARLAECMDGLEPRDAHSIRSAFIEGATYATLAEGAGTPLGTLKSRVRRALLKLRECLE